MNPSELVQQVRQKAVMGYLWAFLGATIGTLMLSPVRAQIDLSNVALLYVLAVVVMAVSFGRGPAVATALYSALCYAYVFVPPHYSLAITEVQYLLSAVIMLIVALIVSHLTSRLKHHADELQRKSVSSRGLYVLARELAGALTPDEVRSATRRFLEVAFEASSVQLIRPDEVDAAQPPASPAMARHCLERRRLVSRPTAEGRFHALLPLIAGDGTQGVLGLEVLTSALASQESVEYLETVASVVAVALERSNFAAIARETEIKHAAETLRSSILAALSHDLRTPLTALVGMADAVVLGKLAPERQHSMLEAIRSQALSITRQMTNLLDMARLSVGKLEPKTDWQPIDEVLGVTMQQIGLQWPARGLALSLESDLPPINIDAVLMERVLWNLIENAIKYSPESAPIDIAIRRSGSDMTIAVCDRGSGVPPAKAARIFETFERGQQESVIPGVGLGLSIAKTIVEAHGGTLAHCPRQGGGSCFTVSLPLGQPPLFDAREDADE